MKSSPANPGATRYLVRQLGWHQNPHGDNYLRRLPYVEPVALHMTFDGAQADCWRREHERRSGENPFCFGGASLFFQTSLDGPRLHDWLLDGGIDPPAEQSSHRSWREWWDAFAHTWTDNQIEHAWHGLDKVRFFDIANEDCDETVHVLVRHRPLGITALQTDERRSGSFQGIFRDARAAAALCEERNLNWHGERMLQSLRARDSVLLFEVNEITSELSEEFNEGFLLYRQAFDRSGRVCHDPEGRDARSCIPLRLLERQSTALQSRDALMAAARTVLNPFQIFMPAMMGPGKEQLIKTIESLQAPLPHPVNLRPEAWREWWDLCQDEMTDCQRAAAWALFPHHPLFEVRRVRLDETGHCPV